MYVFPVLFSLLNMISAFTKKKKLRSEPAPLLGACGIISMGKAVTFVASKSSLFELVKQSNLSFGNVAE